MNKAYQTYASQPSAWDTIYCSSRAIGWILVRFLVRMEIQLYLNCADVELRAIREVHSASSASCRGGSKDQSALAMSSANLLKCLQALGWPCVIAGNDQFTKSNKRPESGPVAAVSSVL